MKLLMLLIISSLVLVATEPKKYLVDVVPEKISVHEKKARFIALVEPAVQKVHTELMQQYQEVKKD
ncbi:MAG: hypothetical protein U9N39_02925, partial [Campylobacterota bacterium]|nr:hypothetical protein [Campylobacterota bacterium]